MNTDKQEPISNGELIDSWSMDEILNHPQFHQLSVVKGIIQGVNPDYWEVRFKSDTKTDKGWLTFTGREVLFQIYVFYKLKQ